MGLDLASRVDYTAYSVIEVLERRRLDAPLPPAPYSDDDLPRETFYRVQMIDRLPHGLGWDEIGGYVVALLAALYEQEAVRLAGQFSSVAAAGGLPRALFADATGLGGSIMGLVQQALYDEARTRDVDVWPLTFTSGQKYRREDGIVGKSHLMHHLEALLAACPRRVQLPKHDPMLPTLLAELDAYHYHLDPATGHETLGGEGAHDDMVTALALGCLDDPGWYRPRSIRFEALGWGPCQPALP